MTNHGVVVTGLGAISAAGAGVTSLWDAVHAGRNCLQLLDDVGSERIRKSYFGRVSADLISQDASPSERAWQMISRSLEEALEAARLELSNCQPERVALVFGGTIALTAYTHRHLTPDDPNNLDQNSRPTALDWARCELREGARKLGIRGPTAMIATACSASLSAIGYGADLIRWGHVDVAVVGGAEAFCLMDYSQYQVLKIITNEQMRPFDRTRKGFFPGEGAGILVLEDEEHARRRGAPLLARCTGYAVNATPSKIVQPEVVGLAQCLQTALNRSGLHSHQIDYICAHGSATVLSDKSETQSIKTVFGDHAYSIAVSAIKPTIGHLMHASGAVEAISVISAIQSDFIPPTINYTNPDPECDLDYVPNQGRSQRINVSVKTASGFGNNNCAVIFERIA